MRFRLRKAAAAAVGLVMLAGATACGGSFGGTGDYGPYSGSRGDSEYDQKPSKSRGSLVESLRLGEHILYATDIDPDLKVGRGGGVAINYLGLQHSVISAATSNAADGHGPLAAFGAIAANKAYVNDDQSEKMLNTSLIEFPDEAAAAAAAADMDRADFQQASADNAPVAVDAFPTALSHWRPGVPTLGSVMAYKSLVIRVFVQLLDPDLGQLVNVVTRAYQRQIEMLANYTPTSPGELPNLKLDPDKLLTRIVHTEDPSPEAMKFAVWGMHAYAALLESPAADASTLTDYAVISMGISYNKRLYKLRDSAAAKAYAEHLRDPEHVADSTPMPGAPGVPDATCTQASKPVTNTLEARRFRCTVQRGEYVAQVWSNTDTDVRHLLAAQYSVMGGTA